MIEIGHIDINTKVSLLSSYSAMLRQGHSEAALHFIGYLKLRHYSRLVFNLIYTNTDHSNFWEYDWKDFLGCAVEAIPPILHHQGEKRCIYVCS